MFLGFSAGTEGLEIGGFANINKHNTKGFQIAGFANYSGGTLNGFQFAGFGNIVADSSNGFQAGGFGCYTGRSLKGIQLGGNSCVTLRNLDGMQIGGLANYAGSVKGAQITGFANACKGKLDGIQVAGYVNYADTVKGAQIASFANVSKRYVKGIQVSGFFNYARKIKGAQIGIVNIADSVKGVSIGLFSFIRKGYRRYEFAANEVFYLNASFKTGTNKFYNIFSVGARYDHQRAGWGIGYGIGTQIDFSPKLFMNAEMSSYYLSYDNYIVTVANNLNRVNVDLGLQLSKHFDVFLGASYNIYISQWYNPDTGEYGQQIAPYKMVSQTWADSDMHMWIGGQAGIRFKEF
jgi:hypothetical protein